MTPINNGKSKRGTFRGEPEGFVALPQGTIFRRRYYQYSVMIRGQLWKKYEGVYYEPNPREFENDYNEVLWFKTTDSTLKTGWIKLPFVPVKSTGMVMDFFYSDNNGNDNIFLKCGDETPSQNGILGDYTSSMSISNKGDNRLNITDIFIVDQDENASVCVLPLNLPFSLNPNQTINFQIISYYDYITNQLRTQNYQTSIQINTSESSCVLKVNATFKLPDVIFDSFEEVMSTDQKFDNFSSVMSGVTVESNVVSIDIGNLVFENLIVY